MNSECSISQQRIPRSLAGDLLPEEQKALEIHLAECPPCRAEHDRYAESLYLLRSAGDEPVPRHFFVYPKEHTANPWQLFRQMMPRWQAAVASVAGLFVLIGVATASGLQIRKDAGSWAVSFGIHGAISGNEIAALKADILRTAEERNREHALDYIQILRSEISGARADLSQQQQIHMVEGLNILESRLYNRMDATAQEIRAGSRKSAEDLYQTVSAQRERDMNAVSARIDKVVENTEVKARQTDTILETLLQVANLTLKLPGEQK